MTDEHRFREIQTLLAHHERQIQDLSDMLLAQGREIDLLKARLERASQKIANIEHASSEGEGEALSVMEQALRDKPPHY